MNILYKSNRRNTVICGRSKFVDQLGVVYDYLYEIRRKISKIVLRLSFTRYAWNYRRSKGQCYRFHFEKKNVGVESYTHCFIMHLTKYNYNLTMMFTLMVYLSKNEKLSVVPLNLLFNNFRQRYVWSFFVFESIFKLKNFENISFDIQRWYFFISRIISLQIIWIEIDQD